MHICFRCDVEFSVFYGEIAFEQEVLVYFAFYCPFCFVNFLKSFEHLFGFLWVQLIFLKYNCQM